MIKFNTTTTNPDIIKIINDKSLLLKDTLISFSVDEDIINILKGELKNDINGIIAIHMCPELGLSNYEKNLGDLIDYIIFYQQNKIVNDRFNVINLYKEFNNITGNIIKKHQRKISSTKNIFPSISKEIQSYFLMDNLNDFSFTFSKSRVQSYFAEFSVSYEYEKTPIDASINPFSNSTYKTNGIYYNIISDYSNYKIEKDEYNIPLPVSGSIITEYTPKKIRMATSSDFIDTRSDQYKDIIPGTIIMNRGVIVQFQEEWIIEKITVDIQGMYGSSMGSIVNSIVNSKDKIIIERKVNPDEFFIIKP